MFKEEIIKRYDKDENGNLIVNVAIPAHKFLFEEFDSTTSFADRDLNENFADYLYGCVNEIGSHPFVIRLDLPKKESGVMKERTVQKSILNYFEYMENLSKINLRRIFFRTMFHFTTSLMLLAVLLFFMGQVNEESVYTTMLIEGLTIAVWVFMWPVFSDFMYNLIQERKDIKIFKKISSSKINFNYY